MLGYALAEIELTDDIPHETQAYELETYYKEKGYE